MIKFVIQTRNFPCKAHVIEGSTYVILNRDFLKKKRKNYRFIVIFNDYLTRWVEAFSVPSAEAIVVARLLIDEMIAL